MDVNQNPGDIAPAEDALIAADDAIISRALDGTVLGWNRAAERMFGFSAAEMLGKPIAVIFPVERLHEEARLLAQIFAGREVSNFDTERLRKDGSRFEVSVTLSPVLDEAQRVVAVSKRVRDLTLTRKLNRDRALAAAIIADSDDAILAQALNGSLLSWNEAAAKLFGYSAEEMIGQPIARLYPSYLLREEARLIEQILAGARVKHFETERIRKDGSLIYISVSLAPIRDASGRIVAISTVARNVTDRVRLQARLDRSSADLAEEHERMRVTLESIGDGVITTDTRGIVQWLNPVAARLTGWSLADAQGQAVERVLPVIHAETRVGAASPVAEALAENRIVGLAPHSVLIARDRQEHAIEDSAAPIRNEAGTVLGSVLVFHDVSEQRRLDKEVGQRATRDALTGLWDRTEFEACLDRAFASVAERGSMHVLMYIDLDQFKLVNDLCGHAVGDRMLREVASLFRSIVRQGDVLARLGGDEFGVLLENCTIQQARRVGESVCERMKSYRFVHEDKRFRVGTSIGMVPVDGRWATPTELMVAADAACYAAKEHGRNRVHEWVDTDTTVIERRGEMQWAAQLEQAIDQGRFRLYGQHVGQCAAGSPRGLHFEVLLRLIDQAGAEVPPGAFLPAAERFHLASRLDRWVIHEVMQVIASQRAAHVDTVAINLSAQSLGDRSFHRYAAQLIESTPLDPARLCLEITETAAITHLSDAHDFIERMRKLGVQIALDDFGAGVSSFGYLKSLPVDMLKIDGQFIRKIVDDRFEHTAVCCFRDVARSCGLKTVAECVESDAVLNELKWIGIDFAQGYAIHRPEPLLGLLAAGAAHA
jgi:diguanylate cyclase (GGDEF)-like protein/PAS domain S-box-containing protein